jgi:hypothetical protein
MYQRLRHNPLTMFDIKLPGGINVVASANGSLFHPSNMAKSSGITWPRSLARGRTAKSTGTSSSAPRFRSHRLYPTVYQAIRPLPSHAVCSDAANIFGDRLGAHPAASPAAGPAHALNRNKKQRNSTVIVTSD